MWLRTQFSVAVILELVFVSAFVVWGTRAWSSHVSAIRADFGYIPIETVLLSVAIILIFIGAALGLVVFPVRAMISAFSHYHRVRPNLSVCGWRLDSCFPVGDQEYYAPRLRIFQVIA